MVSLLREPHVIKVVGDMCMYGLVTDVGTNFCFLRLVFVGGERIVVLGFNTLLSGSIDIIFGEYYSIV